MRYCAWLSLQLVLIIKIRSWFLTQSSWYESRRWHGAIEHRTPTARIDWGTSKYVSMLRQVTLADRGNWQVLAIDDIDDDIKIRNNSNRPGGLATYSKVESVANGGVQTFESNLSRNRSLTRKYRTLCKQEQS